MAGELQNVVDIVFCIDCTGSMGPTIDWVKKKVLDFPGELKEALGRKDVTLHGMRIRVVAFRDLRNDLDAMEASVFFQMEKLKEKENFEKCITKLVPRGGGDEPESGLEALAIACNSDWVQTGDKHRHIIVMFTDASAHRLEDRVGSVPARFSCLMPDSLDELTDIWDGGQAVMLKRPARRLIIFGPDAYPWNTIADAWGQTVYLPSQAGKGLEDVEYSTILETITNSW